MYYSCDRVVKDKLASIARTNGQWQLDARINENTTNYIYVRFQKNDVFTKCNLLGKSNMMKDQPMHESDFVMDWLDRNHEENPISVESIDSKVIRTNIEKNAKARVKNDNLTPTEKIRNTRERRKIEIEKTANKVEDNSVSSPKEKSNSNTETKTASVVYLPRRRR